MEPQILQTDLNIQGWKSHKLKKMLKLFRAKESLEILYSCQEIIIFLRTEKTTAQPGATGDPINQPLNFLGDGYHGF
jgi:hypothetical protein